MVGSHKVNSATLERFRTFGCVAHNKDRFAKARSFFLNTAGISEDNGGFLHQIDELQVLEGFDEEEVGTSEVFAEHLVDRLAHVWIEVHRINEIHIGILLAQVLHGSHHADETFSEVLTAMAGDEDKFLAAVKAGDVVAGGFEHIDLLIGKSFVALEFIDHHVKRVDDRVAGDEDLSMGLFLLEVLLAEGRRGEIVGGDATGNLSVHLLRPRAIDVVRPETCLNMAHRDLLVESGEGGGGAGGRVAMDQDHIGLALLKHVAHTGKHAGSHVVQVLPLLHDIQVIVRLYIEDAKYLIQHLPVLTGHAHDRLKLLRILLELLHQRAHLDGLRAGSENEHYSLHYIDFLY